MKYMNYTNQIPKIIHTSWITKDLLNNNHPLIQNGLIKLKELNPDWKLNISTDDEVEDYLKNNLDKNDYDLLINKSIVEKIDCWRLIKIYNEGGLYIDIDRLHDIPIDLNPNIKCVLPICKYSDFSHDFMLSEPNNPIYLETLKLNLQRRKNGYTNIYFLGAQTYMHAITKLLIGEYVNTNPDIHTMKQLIKTIHESGFISTYIEYPPLNTITFTNKIKISKYEHESMKRSFYTENKIKHWTKEW